MPHRVSKAQFAKLVERAIAELPPKFARALQEVSIEIKDRPSRKLLRSLGMADDELLLGVYTGRPLTERSVDDAPSLPDTIQIFQEDCEEVSESEADLVREVRITVLHELGHHFGLDEGELERLGYD